MKIDTKISLVILAGGKSSRMGTDKAALFYQGKTFLEQQIEKGRTLGIRKILLSGCRSEKGEYPWIPDEQKERGPLGGMLSCFREIGDGAALVLSIDMPLVRVEDLEQLILIAEQQSEGDKKLERPIIFSHNGKEEPFPGIYPVSLIPLLEEELTQGKGSVFAFLRKASYQVVETTTPDQCFVNVNDPVKYENLLKQNNE